MSSREKRLLIALGSALFVVVSLFGFKTLTTKTREIEAQADGLRTRLEGLMFMDETREGLMDEVEWLEKNQPTPKEGELVPSAL
ncbi:MAG: hypothetical protein ACQKBU_01440, partial [Verrucomicrobiales bacterium]